MEFNPWNVLSLEAYHFYFCPECESKHETKDRFVGHAIVEHPRAREFIPRIVDVDTVQTEPEHEDLEEDTESNVNNDNVHSDSEYHNEEVESDPETDLDNNAGPLTDTEVNEDYEPMTEQDQLVEGSIEVKNESVIKTEIIEQDFSEVDINTIISNEKIEPMTVDFKESFSEAKNDTKSRKSVKKTKTSMVNIKSDYLTRKAYCFICKDFKTKLTRHFQSVHKEHPKIKPLLSLDTTERNKGLELIKNKGTHEHNCQVLDKGVGDFIVLKKPNDTLAKPSDYIFCPFCFKYVLKTSLSGHETKCEFRPTEELLGKSELKKKSAEILKERKLKMSRYEINSDVIIPHFYRKIPKHNIKNRAVNKDIKEYFAEFIKNSVIPRRSEVIPYLEIMQEKFPDCTYSWTKVKEIVHSYIKWLKKSQAKKSE